MPVEVQVYVATEGRIEDGSPIVTARVVGHLGGRFDRTVYVLELPCGRVVFRGVHECAQPSQRQWQIPFSRN